MLMDSPRGLFAKCESKITRETNTDVNRFAARPQTKVTANHLVGPLPNTNKIAAETMVVMCVSTMVSHAHANHGSTACAGTLPDRNKRAKSFADWSLKPPSMMPES